MMQVIMEHFADFASKSSLRSDGRLPPPQLCFLIRRRKIQAKSHEDRQDSTAVTTLLLPLPQCSDYARVYGSVGDGAGKWKPRQLHSRIQLGNKAADRCRPLLPRAAAPSAAVRRKPTHN